MTGNPFYARGPIEPQYFANRKDLLEFFTENVREVSESDNTKPDNIAILGNWGVGKTSALLKFQDIIHNEMKDSAATFSVLLSLKPSVCEDADVFTLECTPITPKPPAIKAEGFSILGGSILDGNFQIKMLTSCVGNSQNFKVS